MTEQDKDQLRARWERKHAARQKAAEKYRRSLSSPNPRPRPAGAVERNGTRLNTLLLLALLGLAFALATASLGCSSSRNSSSQYPITQPLDPVTERPIHAHP
jgi:hypothetical protein